MILTSNNNLNRKEKGQRYILLFSSLLCFIFSIFPLGAATEDGTPETIDFYLDGAHVVRSGNTIIIRAIIMNVANGTDITIDKISIINSKDAIIKIDTINKTIRPIGTN